MGGVATNHLAMLRERVQRQRSVVLGTDHPAKTNSLEDVVEKKREELDPPVKNVDFLDTQISNLHQDVATLSMEVCCSFIFNIFSK